MDRHSSNLSKTTEYGIFIQLKCLFSACYVLNIVQGTWDTSENKTRSPALVERTVYHVSPLHLCTASDPGQVTAPFCPMG